MEELNDVMDGLSLSIFDPGLTESRLQMLTLEMAAGLNRARGLEAKIGHGPAQSGMKGDPTSVGIIVMKLLGSGGAVAVLLNALKGYFLRKQALVIEVKRQDGTRFTLRAENLSEVHMAQTTAQLIKFLKA